MEIASFGVHKQRVGRDVVRTGGHAPIVPTAVVPHVVIVYVRHAAASAKVDAAAFAIEGSGRIAYDDIVTDGRAVGGVENAAPAASGRVALEGVVLDGRAAGGVENAATAASDRVALEGVVLDGRAAGPVEDAAAVGSVGVVAKGVVLDGRAAGGVVDAAAVSSGGVVAKGVVLDGRAAGVVVDAAALRAGCITQDLSATDQGRRTGDDNPSICAVLHRRIDQLHLVAGQVQETIFTATVFQDSMVQDAGTTRQKR